MKCPIGHCPNENSISEKPELFANHFSVWHNKTGIGETFLKLTKFWNEHGGPALV